MLSKAFEAMNFSVFFMILLVAALFGVAKSDGPPKVTTFMDKHPPDVCVGKSCAPGTYKND